MITHLIFVGLLSLLSSSLCQGMMHYAIYCYDRAKRMQLPVHVPLCFFWHFCVVKCLWYMNNVFVHVNVSLNISLFCSSACNPNILLNMDFPGNDITFLYSPDVNHCQLLCTQHPSCLFFSFIRVDWTHDDRYDWHKWVAIYTRTYPGPSCSGRL